MTSDRTELAAGYCGGCAHLSRVFGMAVCCAWDIGLKKDEGHAVRCKECLNHGINKEQGED